MDADRPGMGLVLAIVAGILPVVLANRSAVSADSYDSRYLLPVLPFVSIAVVYGLDRLTTPRLRPVVEAALAFLAAYRIVVGAFEARQEQARMEEFGELLRPLVQGSPGITVAVVPDRWLDGSDMTPKVTWRWNSGDARRLWVMPASRAATEFGPRQACHGTDRISLARELLSTGRDGPVSHLVFASPWDGAVGGLEPYCIGAMR